MRTKKILSLLLLTAAFTACNNEENLQTMDNNTPMSVTVTNQTHSRALVETTTLPDASQIGVTLVDNSGTTYDGTTYNNLLYTLSGTEWTTANTPMLTDVTGKAVAYYPYSNAVTDVTAIPVTFDAQTDYLYSGWVTKLDKEKAEANFQMNHALAVVKLVLKKSAEYTGAVSVKDVNIQSDMLHTAATLDATTGTLSNLQGAGMTITKTAWNEPLTAEGVELQYLVVPNTTASDITFDITMSNNVRYVTAVTPGTSLEQGKIHTYTLLLTAEKLVVEGVSVNEYTTGDQQEKEMEKYNPWNYVTLIDAATAPNGVYAVAPEGELVQDINQLTDEIAGQCTAVALIVNDAPTPQRLMIAKADATDGTNTPLYWGYNLKDKDVTGITNIGSGYGYLPKADGTYNSTPNLSADYTTWTSGGLSNFNGKANTTAIINAYAEHAVEMNTQDMCSALNTFNSSDAYGDWYVPACGQLALIYLNRTEINEALTAIGGTVYNTSTGYWSSSEYSSNYGWLVYFYNGSVFFNNKHLIYRVRFVRDIE